MRSPRMRRVDEAVHVAGSDVAAIVEQEIDAPPPLEHGRDRIAAERIGIRLDRERRAARKTDARVVAGAGIGVDAETFAHHAPPLRTSTAEARA